VTVGYRFLTDHYPSATLLPCPEAGPNQRLGYETELPHGPEVRVILGPDLQILQRHHAPVTALLDIDEHAMEIGLEGGVTDSQHGHLATDGEIAS